MVDDNAYTNLMARLNLRYAGDVRRLQAEHPEAMAALRVELLDPSEADQWDCAAERMYVPA